MSKSDTPKTDRPKPLAGGVRHDARGNAVWQWAAETARHAVASTSQLLRRLEVSNIKLEELDENKLPPGKAGFNPYDGAAVTRTASPKQHAAAKKPSAGNRAAAAPVRARKSWWRSLFQRR